MMEPDHNAAFAAHLAETIRSGLPIEPGLRALSEEISSRSQRQAVLRLCGRLEAGESLETALAAERRALPPDLALLLASARQAGFVEVLDEYARQQAVVSELRWRAAGAIAYPALLAFVSGALVIAGLCWFVPMFIELWWQQSTTTFGFYVGPPEPPLSVRVLNRISNLLTRFGPQLLLTALFVVVAAMVAGLVKEGWPEVVRGFHALPLVGRGFRDIQAGRFCRMLALLIERDATLPAALRTAGGTNGNAGIGRGALRLADEIECGGAAASKADAIPELPVAVGHALRLAERGDPREVVCRSLRAAGHALEARCLARCDVLTGLVEPVVVLAVGALVIVGALVLLLPILKAVMSYALM